MRRLTRASRTRGLAFRSEVPRATIGVPKHLLRDILLALAEATFGDAMSSGLAERATHVFLDLLDEDHGHDVGRDRLVEIPLPQGATRHELGVVGHELVEVRDVGFLCKEEGVVKEHSPKGRLDETLAVWDGGVQHGERSPPGRADEHVVGSEDRVDLVFLGILPSELVVVPFLEVDILGDAGRFVNPKLEEPRLPIVFEEHVGLDAGREKVGTAKEAEKGSGVQEST